MAEADREHWDRRYREGSHSEAEPPVWLDALAEELPRAARGARALDVAAGTGRIACWLARRGFEASALDVSPVGLEVCCERALGLGVQVETRACDLESEPLPEGPFAVISCFHYLQRDLFPVFRERLTPGGVLLCELPTLRNLERSPHPSARFLIEPNELLSLVEPLEIVHYREGWLDGRSLACVLARKAA